MQFLFFEKFKKLFFSVKNYLTGIYIWNVYFILNLVTTPFQKTVCSYIYHRKKVIISKTRWEKVENFTLNPYILDNFAFNIWNRLSADFQMMSESKSILKKGSFFELLVRIKTSKNDPFLNRFLLTHVFSTQIFFYFCVLSRVLHMGDSGIVK